MQRLLGRDPSSFSKWSPYRGLSRRRTAGRAAAVAATLTVLALLARLASVRLVRLEVEGVSMVPTFAPGDRVLVLRTRDVSIGDLVAVEDPEATQRVLVKRVVGLDRNSVRVEGDNSGASRDSRDFGPVRRAAIVGRVVTRYHSPSRYAPRGP